MAHRSQCSSAGDNSLDPNYLPPHYREEYRMAIDALVEADLEGYYGFLQEADVVDFLSRSEIEYIKHIVQAPHHAAQPERRYMAEDVDGSSDTYWPVHSDHDAPSLDLGWPQQYRFIGPTEVTTLVNPSDPEMPSIKEQVRRMIKNAQQVIAVVMDMFTDVDIFADILCAATRGVAVYVLLDELNAHHFVGMVNNCRVNLDEIKFMRVRTVSGSTYYCRTGKTFKGQMMDRFILVDCRAVLSGNYSFMWSFEKIHRCLAHLFLGQLVTTFDEEFRILFAHSEPLVVENVLANMPHYGGPVYPHEGDEAEPPGAYDHIQRYLQSQPAMEEGHGPRNVLPHMQSNLKRHSMGQSYT
uniref:Family with sequence similarity 83 member Ha n=1 Tax=Cyprinus carpio TaxID=7962 RepID=A0A8C1M3R9_CYPCA